MIRKVAGEEGGNDDSRIVGRGGNRAGSVPAISTVQYSDLSHLVTQILDDSEQVKQQYILIQCPR